MRPAKSIKWSATKPAVKVVEENADELETVVTCPNCGQPTPLGATRMTSGWIGCDNLLEDGVTECYYGDLRPRVLRLKETGDERYVRGPVYLMDIKEGEA